MKKGYTFVILLSMKTAVSIPDTLFLEAEKTAKQLGLARSQLYAKALEEFIELHNDDQVTEKLNAVYSMTDSESGNLDAGIESLRESTKDDSW